MFLNKILRWFVVLWVGLILWANLLGIVGLFMTSEDVWSGIGRVQEIYSPFNIINYVAEIIALLPAIGAYMWLEKRRAKIARAS